MSRAVAKQLIDRRYALAHGAVPDTSYPHFCVVRDQGQSIKAALGFRFASEGRLFLEDYLDAPVEQVVQGAIGTAISRDRIVEVGAHASERNHATVRLWARTARHLEQQADVAVGVLTSSLRNMLERLGIGIVDICAADAGRLPASGDQWGRYYEQHPRVCCGLIGPAFSRLTLFDDDVIEACR